MFPCDTPKGSGCRQRILSTAAELFYRKGFQHVGINEVIASSNVAKRTFYKYFPSKDELIVSVMHYQATQWLEWFESSLKKWESPKEKILESLDILHEWYTSPDFYGCPFVKAALEIADAKHPAHQIAVIVRQSIRLQILQLALEAKIPNAETFSQQYLLLIGGSILMATIEGTPMGAKYARETIVALINAS
jgi:AcrR family transcriptional regulator